MCLKRKKELEDSILQTIEELRTIIKRSRLKEKLIQYEIVRQRGLYNMLDDRARKQAKLTEEDYDFITKNYSKLMLEFPDVKNIANSEIQHRKSARIAGLISICGCKNCIEIVSKKLDVTENDLCDKCKELITSQLNHISII